MHNSYRQSCAESCKNHMLAFISISGEDDMFCALNVDQDSTTILHFAISDVLKNVKMITRSSQQYAHNQISYDIFSNLSTSILQLNSMPLLPVNPHSLWEPFKGHKGCRKLVHLKVQNVILERRAPSVQNKNGAAHGRGQNTFPRNTVDIFISQPTASTTVLSSFLAAEWAAETQSCRRHCIKSTGTAPPYTFQSCLLCWWLNAAMEFQRVVGQIGKNMAVAPGVP